MLPIVKSARKIACKTSLHKDKALSTRKFKKGFKIGKSNCLEK